ncbi:MAG: NADH-quinone oxidoreductase subunit NuoK [Candidatus Aminicenantes bacterium]|nr:NADH-quinone oxidoreductase subunit NuoK [Candidatus Aminicenantes bacterium]
MSSAWFVYMGCAAVLLFLGLYCLLTMRNLIKLFIGIEILGKAVTLGLIATGSAKNSILTAQALAVTFIVVEVCVVATALAIIINIYRHTKSLDVRKLTQLKG